MNSTLVLEEEPRTTSSIEPSTILKYKIPHVPLMLFEDEATTATTAFTSDPSPYFGCFVTAPKIDLSFVQRQEPKRVSFARPVISPLEFESNPIVRVYPATGKRYPMMVVRRSTASFKPTSVRVFEEEV